MTTEIAVVVPCFNDGRFLPATVRSAAGADSIVVIDDGSTDPSTQTVLDELEHRVPQVRVVRQANQGTAAARMAGVRAAGTEWILPLDADDRLCPGALDALRAAVRQAEDIDFVFGDHVRTGDASGVWRAPEFHPWLCAYANWWSPVALFRASLIEAIGGWVALHEYEDWDFWMAVAESGARGVHCGTPIYFRRVHANRRQADGRRAHRRIYAELQRRHPGLFTALEDHRRAYAPSLWQRLAYPLFLGARPLMPARLEPLLLHLWTAGDGRRARS